MSRNGESFTGKLRYESVFVFVELFNKISQLYLDASFFNLLFSKPWGMLRYNFMGHRFSKACLGTHNSMA